MRKIESLNQSKYLNDLLDKINELVDAVNELAEWNQLHREYHERQGRKQTQEPKCQLIGLTTKDDTRWCNTHDRWCPVKEKPAKKECAKNAPSDELAEPSLALRLMRVMYSTPEAMLTSDRIESVADEARAWAVEIIEQVQKEPRESNMETLNYVNEIKFRLKGGRC